MILHRQGKDPLRFYSIQSFSTTKEKHMSARWKILFHYFRFLVSPIELLPSYQSEF